jgi:hypothetical protein
LSTPYPQQLVDEVVISVGAVVTYQPPESVISSTNWQPGAFGVSGNTLIVFNSYFDGTSVYISQFFFFNLETGEYLSQQTPPELVGQTSITIAPQIANAGSQVIFGANNYPNLYLYGVTGTTVTLIANIVADNSLNVNNQWMGGLLNMDVGLTGACYSTNTKGETSTIQLPNPDWTYVWMGYGWYMVSYVFNDNYAAYNALTGKTIIFPTNYIITSASMMGNSLLLFGIDTYLLSPDGNLQSYTNSNIINGIYTNQPIFNLYIINDGYFALGILSGGVLYLGNSVSGPVGSSGNYSTYYADRVVNMLSRISIQSYPLSYTLPNIAASQITNRPVKNFTVNGYLKWRKQR